MILGECLKLQDADGIKDYAFLGTPKEGGAVFLARIPDIMTTKIIMKTESKLIVGARTQRVSQRLSSDLYFFVELTTEEFKNRVVILANTDYPETKMQEYCGELPRLNEVDINKIKEKILGASNSSVSPKLKEIIRDLDEKK